MPSEPVSQREYFERLFEEFEKRVNDRFSAQALALKLQADANDIRVAALNQGQASLVADRDRYTLREVVDAKWGEYDRWRTSVSTRLSETAGQSKGVSLSWAIVVAVLGIGMTVITMMKHA